MMQKHMGHATNMDSTVCEIEHLVNLFNTQKNESSDSEDDQQSFPQEGNAKKSKTKKVNPYAKIEAEPKKRKGDGDPDKMVDDILNEENKAHESDWKHTPKWDISYRQQVTASDVFLQMGFKTPATSSCENMIVTVELPGENQKNIDLKIHQRNICLRSPRFYLDIPLPQPVDPQQGNAQFDSDCGKLTITLKLDRELDIVNF